MIGIYKIISPSGKIYIGQSTDIKKRFDSYRRIDLRIKGQIKLYRSLKKYGSKNHKYEIIEQCLCSKLNERERHWQEYYDVIGENGLNCLLVKTDTKKCIISEETKKKISIANVKRKWSEKQRLLMLGNKPNLGKKCSEETKKKISQFHKGNKYNLGRKQSENMIKNRIEKNTKVILDINSGVFYSAQEYSVLYNIKYNTLIARLTRNTKKNTNLIYV